ncbi:hypothetical protein CXF85_12030 [Colwellia sp. 75C3]|uniref:DUF4123 domain-containing protein n=1 Tax=Colwellia sp. 75C3 TaxID=888425 RepID=UPI000C33A0F8|nr:DUF4123 domain-containing protein [Colwellia sp. 75C3]PKG83069.1 hypothetical protein CXF85_12030 [Colwellia sp. 75C3]
MTTTPLAPLDINRIQQQLWQVNDSGKLPVVYAILGGARDKQIEKIIRLGSLKNSCLIGGKLSYEMAIAAPYMVRLEKDHPQTIEILKKGWGNSWGIFAITHPPATLINIRQNCKKMAMVQLPDDKRAYFRYYDPRVMRPYLPTCTIEEANKVFGHISEYIMEGEESGTIHRFKRDEDGVVDLGSVLTNDCTQDEITVTDADIAELNEINTAISEKVGLDVIRQATGLLKLKPLINTDQNDKNALLEIINQALVFCDSFELVVVTPEPLTQLALAIEQWGIDFFINASWIAPLLASNEFTFEEKVNELFLEKAFLDVGSNVIDFSSYCILRFNNRYADNDFENVDIHVAAQIALEICQQKKINGLTNNYLCTEMILVNGGNFMEDDTCVEVQHIFTSDILTSQQKVTQGISWLYAQH